ncbi:MAG TPA: hypothetical protein VJI68_01310 [Candidatus Nanoarchaeia archaeon]|nr:hypothetical protein [Candidatus Nanoarchaeia archaeon]
MAIKKKELVKKVKDAEKPTEDQIKETLLEIGGEFSYELYKILKGKENVDEFDIAEKIKISINQLRNLIYKFEQYNLISSTRKKDRKKGWYIYFFTLNQRQVEDMVKKIKSDKIKKLEKQLERETNFQFYRCPNKCIRIPTENAMENNFLCVECGSLLEHEDQEKIVSKIKRSIKDLAEA